MASAVERHRGRAKFEGQLGEKGSLTWRAQEFERGPERRKPPRGQRHGLTPIRIIPPLNTMMLAFTENDHWEPGIGDLTVVAYFLAAWLCWRAARRSRVSAQSWRGGGGFWALFTVALVFLGFNKQL